jgi:hypothetical protein
MSRRSDSKRDDRGDSRGGALEDDPELGVAIGILALVVTPWVFAIFERTNFADFDVGGPKPLRAVWVAPLFYIGAAAGTFLLLPQYLEFFWAFHLMLAAEAADLLVAYQFTNPLNLFPFDPQITQLRAGVALALTAGLAIAARLCYHWEVAYRYQQTLDAGQYLLPYAAITDRSDRLAATHAVALEKDRSILVLGETGAGKTATLTLLAYQLQTGPDEPFIVFDYKGEYQEFLESSNHDRDVITLSSIDASCQWNLFEEIEREAEIDEIASAMFPSTDDADFFSNAARQLFVAVITYLRRQAEWEGTTPTNADLVTFVQTMDKEEMYDRLSDHPDLVAAASAIDPDADRQAAGVYANFQQVIADLFRGDFAEDGTFSIREYMANPDGRTLVLDFPIREGDAVQPAFRFFVDWSARFALTDTRGSYFLLDEFARLPGLRKVGDMINAGRSSNTQLLLGLQSVAQMHDTYGQDKANALLSGLVQSIVLRVGDAPSFEYVREQLGRDQERRTVPSHDHRGRSIGRQEITDETYPIASGDLVRLADGEAIAIRPDGWVRGQLHELSDVRRKLDRALEKIR